MVRLEITNSLTRVWASPDFARALDDATSYPVEGAKFHPAYQSKAWDGREHLLRRSRRGDFWLLPTGLLPDLGDLIAGAEVVDSRRLPRERADLEWVGKPLRDYQLEAIERSCEDRGPWTGRGMLNLPIRSGKTMTTAGIIQRTGLRTLFVVPSELLLFQTAEAFRQALRPCPVGLVGAGHCDPQWITIATAQTLLVRKGLAARLLAESDLLVVDEAHHLEGPAWRGLLVKSDSSMKVGLSATIFVSRERENNKASIWLKACTGPVLHRVSMASLMDAGHLMRPRILFYAFKHANPGKGWAWQRVAKECLAQNPARNALLVELVARAVARGHRVLVDTGRHDQMRALRDALGARRIRTELVHGKTPAEERWPIIERFQAREVPVIIGTVFGEGVDIPELEVVVNAEGQKSTKAAIQRMRNLTPFEGKGEVLFVDVADVGQKFLQAHALERLRVYRGTRGFRVEACRLGDPARDPLA